MAATACDMYVDWHTGSDGNALSDAMAAGSCYPTDTPYTPEAYPGDPLNAMFIETDSASPISGVFLCDGVTYDIGDTTQGAIYNHTGDYEDIWSFDIDANPDVMSMGFLFKTTLATEWAWYAQSGMVGSGEWALLATRYFDGAQHLYMHTAGGYSAASIEINNNTWYWATIQYNATAEKGYLAVYLASTMVQVGSTIDDDLAVSPSGVSYTAIGQHANQGNQEATYTWFGPAVFDWTDGTFPLLPGVATVYGTVIYEAFIGGPQINPIWVSPALTFMTAWDVTLKKISGTDRAISWSIRKVLSRTITEAFAESQTITTSEHSLPADAEYDGNSPQTGDGLYQVFLDVSALAGADLFQFRIYEETA